MSKAGFQCFTPVTGTINIGNWEQMPNLGIELGGVEVGCTTDAVTGAVTGKVFLVIEKSEDGLTTSSVLKQIAFATGVITDPYVGPIGLCEAPAAPQLQAVQLEEMCLRVDGVAQRVVPVAIFNQATGVFSAPQYVNEMGVPITGVVTMADACECSCTGPCASFVACGRLVGWDYVEIASLTPGQTQVFEILLNGVVVQTVVHDYLTTAAGNVKSSWYTPVIAAVNAQPGWTMTLLQDVAADNTAPNTVNGQNKPVWLLEYAGSSPSSLIIRNEGGNLEKEVAVNAAGLVTVRSDAGGIGAGTGTPTAFPCV